MKIILKILKYFLVLLKKDVILHYVIHNTANEKFNSCNLRSDGFKRECIYKDSSSICRFLKKKWC
ncbi:hypothetical protein CCYN49044_340054 [Capnocytophaga cynodegmi]|nr:hypothetical protein CCYN49044_340054 [Capnocytophaga cynodegmi]